MNTSANNNKIDPKTLADIKSMAHAAIGRNNALLSVQSAPPREDLHLIPEVVLALVDAALVGMALDAPKLAGAAPEPDAPIPMLLTCPSCGQRHVDQGEFATKRHHTHACQHCGMVWRPARVHTVGVQFLPGYKDRAQASEPEADLVTLDDAIMQHGRELAEAQAIKDKVAAKIALGADGTGKPRDYDHIPPGARIFCLLGILRDKMPAEAVEAFQELASELNSRAPQAESQMFAEFMRMANRCVKMADEIKDLRARLTATHLTGEVIERAIIEGIEDFSYRDQEGNLKFTKELKQTIPSIMEDVRKRLSAADKKIMDASVKPEQPT